MCLTSVFDLSKINVVSGRQTIAVTHDKKMQADDIFAGALLKLAIGEDNVIIKRTRDFNEALNADIIFDMGLKYDGFKVFDHHQEEDSIYSDKIYESPKHCAFTLLAKSLIKEERVYNRFMTLIGWGIAIRDNGQTPFLGKYSSLGLWAKYFNETYYEDCENDVNYELAVNFAQAILIRVFKHIDAWFKTEELLRGVLDKSDKILILDKYLPYEDYTCDNYPNILMAIYPSVDYSEWFLTTLPKQKGDQKSHKIYMPVEWRGYSRNNFDVLEGHEECKFVSYKGTHSSWKTKESAISAANEILQSSNIV